MMEGPSARLIRQSALPSLTSITCADECRRPVLGAGAGGAQQQVAEFKRQYDGERAKLAAALEKGALLGSKLQAPHPPQHTRTPRA